MFIVSLFRVRTVASVLRVVASAGVVIVNFSRGGSFLLIPTFLCSIVQIQRAGDFRERRDEIFLGSRQLFRENEVGWPWRWRDRLWHR